MPQNEQSCRQPKSDIIFALLGPCPPRWVRSRLSAGSRLVCDNRRGTCCSWLRTFWCKPVSAFGLCDITTFISGSPELTIPSLTLAPDGGCAGRRHHSSQRDDHLRVELQCPKSFTRSDYSGRMSW